MELTARSQSPSGTNSDGSGSISDSNSQGAGPSQTWQELHAVVNRFCGLGMIVFAVQPMVMIQTAAINQRTQEMGEAPAQLCKVSHDKDQGLPGYGTLPAFQDPCISDKGPAAAQQPHLCGLHLAVSD